MTVRDDFQQLIYETSCLGKRRWSKRQAKEAASRLSRRSGEIINWYRCPFCRADGWRRHCYHVGRSHTGLAQAGAERVSLCPAEGNV